jgi:hypothetical protein
VTKNPGSEPINSEKYAPTGYISKNLFTWKNEKKINTFYHEYTGRSVERGYLRGLGRAFVVHKTGTLNTVHMICLQNRILLPTL